MRPPRATCSACSGVFRSGAGATGGASAGGGAVACVSFASAVSGAWLMLGSTDKDSRGHLYPLEPPLSRNLRDFAAPAFFPLSRLRERVAVRSTAGRGRDLLRR